MKFAATFIIGAGASAEFNLPVGRKLLEDVAKAFEFSTTYPDWDDWVSKSPIAAAVYRYAAQPRSEETFQKYTDAAKRIYKGATLSTSIDRFINIHKRNQELTLLAKLAICKVIFEAERESTIAPTYRQEVKRGSRIRNRSNFDIRYLYGTEKVVKPADTWLAKVFRILAEDVEFDEFLRNLSTVAFVCFNYDRCIERFFLIAARDFFPESDFDETKLIESLNIVHPYGSLGKRNSLEGEEWFGIKPQDRDLMEAADQIRTFTEGAQNDEIVAGISSYLRQTENIFFMGFGFLELNLRLLAGSGPFQANRVYATFFGIPENDVRRLRNGIFDSFVAGGMRNRTLSDNSWVFGGDFRCSKLIDVHGLEIANKLLRSRDGFGYH